MTAPRQNADDDRKQPRVHFDRHTPEYRDQFEERTRAFHQGCPLAWTDTYGGHWVAADNREPLAFARAQEKLSHDHDVHGERRGLGIHRRIGSNGARTVFKRMPLHVLDRIPDHVRDPEGTVHYETIGVIQGMRHLPADLTPGRRPGPGLAETLETLQRACDEQGLAEPVTVRTAEAKVR